MRKGIRKVWRMGVVPGIVWDAKASGMVAVPKESVRNPTCQCDGEEECLFHSTWKSTAWKMSKSWRVLPRCFWAQAVRTRPCEEHMNGSWRRQIWEATSGRKVQGLAGAVFLRNDNLRNHTSNLGMFFEQLEDATMIDAEQLPRRNQGNVAHTCKQEVYFGTLVGQQKKKT